MMTKRGPWHIHGHQPRHADRGATLIIVLIIISVVGLVMGAVLSQTDTSVRATLAMDNQAADNYAADAATQAILNSLQRSGINCNNPTNPVPFPLGTIGTPFYVPVSASEGATNATAKCTPDAIVGAGTTTSQPAPVTAVSTVTPAPVTSTGTSLGQGDPTLPSYALLTTGSAAGDFGIDISTSANNKTVCIENGSVGSNDDINSSGQTLAVRLTGTGTSDCTTGTGVNSDGSRLVLNASGNCIGGASAFKPTGCTSSAPSIATPTAPSLPGSIGNTDPAPVCKTAGGKTYAAFVPGYYTTAAKLTNPCGTGSNVFEWLSPGTYFFNFGATTWTWPSTFVGGTPITNSGAAVPGVNATNANSLTNLSSTATAPNACADPASGSGVQGVQLVFAGSSVVSAPSGSTSQICASSPNASPPVAIYGLPTATTVGSVTLPAETMCSASGCGTNTLITTDPSAQANVYIKGYVYAPNAQVIMGLKNSNGQLFNWGIVVRNFRLSVNGTSPTSPFVLLPKPTTGVGVIVTTSTPPPYPTTTVSTPVPIVSATYTIRYINVWTCLASSLSVAQPTCPTPMGAGAGPVVQVKVLTDTSGKIVKILSWNHL
jgi:Tfp pilus assembly protein PilX